MGKALAARDRADALRAPLAELAGRAGCTADGQPGAQRRRAAEPFVAEWFQPTEGKDAVPALQAADRAALLARAGDRIARTVTEQKTFGDLMAALRDGTATPETRTALATALAACPPPPSSEPGTSGSPGTGGA